MAYIDTKYLGKCETCRRLKSGKCDTFCDSGESYSPDMTKIPTADVVPKSEVDMWFRGCEELQERLIEAVNGGANG